MKEFKMQNKVSFKEDIKMWFKWYQVVLNVLWFLTLCFAIMAFKIDVQPYEILSLGEWTEIQKDYILNNDIWIYLVALFIALNLIIHDYQLRLYRRDLTQYVWHRDYEDMEDLADKDLG